MALNIISNYAANVAHRNLQASDEAATRSLAKLSSGTRVVSARDDAASMAIGARLNAESQALKTATVNVGQANSMLQIADGGMNTINDVLTRMKTLSVQASSGNVSDTERTYLNDEFGALKNEIDRVSSSTSFNGVQLLGSDSALEATTATYGAGTGASLSSANGFQTGGLVVAGNSPLADGDTVAVSLDEIGATGQIMMTLTGSGGQAQSIDVSEYATGGSKAIATGKTASLNFDELGIKIELNENFGATVTNVDANGSNDFTGGGAETALTFSVAAAGTGAALGNVDFQIGTGNGGNDKISISLTAVDTSNLGNKINAGAATLNSADLTDATNAGLAIDIVGNSINDLQKARASIGVYQNRLDFAAQNLSTSQENTEAARSTLMDLDVASEMTAFSAKQVLVQSGVAMLAQANQMPQNLLRLLQ
jgi:flagellin